MAPTDASASGAAVLVGGVGQLYQGDFDLGRLAVERLAGDELGDHVVVEELHYGGVAVAQTLQDLRPQALVLVGAAARGRPAGAVERRRLRPLSLSAEDVRQAVAEAVTGYVSIDLLVEVASGLEALPPRTVAIEVEPASTDVSLSLSPEALAALEPALELVRAEVERAPLLAAADRARDLLEGERLQRTPAVDALARLLGELASLDEHGTWGETFARRDELRRQLSAAGAPDGMEHEDWIRWWELLEELDRLETHPTTTGGTAWSSSAGPSRATS